LKHSGQSQFRRGMYTGHLRIIALAPRAGNIRAEENGDCSGIHQ